MLEYISLYMYVAPLITNQEVKALSVKKKQILSISRRNPLKQQLLVNEYFIMFKLVI